MNDFELFTTMLTRAGIVWTSDVNSVNTKTVVVYETSSSGGYVEFH